MAKIPYGYCQCGCGAKTTIPKTTDRSMGRFKGVPMRFVQGHYRRQSGHTKVPWQESRRTKLVNGYIVVRVGKAHPMADKNGRTYEHRMVMSEALGRPLEGHEHIHHINGVRTDNRLENLEIFASQGDHMRYHARLKSGEI